MSGLVLTGATGYLGSRLTAALLAARHEIILLKRSFSDVRRIEKLLPQCAHYDVDRVSAEEVFRRHSVSGIVHVAANYGRGGESSARLLEDNVLFPLSLLEAARGKAWFFVNAGTSLPPDVSAYALAKEQFRVWLHLFGAETAAYHLRLEHFYGPGDDAHKFVTKIVRALVEGQPAIDLTQGTQKRNFIFIDDVVEAFVKVVERAANDRAPGYRELAVGSEQPVELRELVRLVARLSANEETRLNFGAVPIRPHEVLESKVDTDALRKMGWAPTVDLEDGLRRTIDFERRRVGPDHSS